MKRFLQGAMIVAMLSACSSDSTFLQEEEEEDTTTSEPDTGTGVTGDRTVPPGTASPEPSTGIFRTEPTQAQGGESGDGFVTDVSYNAADDTFTVDNLGFDGDNTYTRGTAVSSLGPYAVYEAAAQFPSSGSGTPINQFTHRAIYGVSTSGNARFAIVRTGSYVNYGFGGFVYQRDGGVTLPTSGQASYAGEYAGLRDFKGAGGLQYTRGDANIAIDFDDFNDTTGTRGDAVQGSITNRRIYDLSGNEVTQSIINAINDDTNSNLTALPGIGFTIAPGVLDNNGEIVGEVTSNFVNGDGATTQLESGKYYALVSGSNADEIVGVVVTTSTLGAPDGATARETGGFVVYRN